MVAPSRVTRRKPSPPSTAATNSTYTGVSPALAPEVRAHEHQGTRRPRTPRTDQPLPVLRRRHPPRGQRLQTLWSRLPRSPRRETPEEARESTKRANLILRRGTARCLWHGATRPDRRFATPETWKASSRRGPSTCSRARLSGTARSCSCSPAAIAPPPMRCSISGRSPWRQSQPTSCSNSTCGCRWFSRREADGPRSSTKAGDLGGRRARRHVHLRTRLQYRRSPARMAVFQVGEE